MSYIRVYTYRFIAFTLSEEFELTHTSLRRDSIEDKSKLISRAELPHLQVVAKAIRDEDLLRQPLKYSVLADLGFWMR